MIESTIESPSFSIVTVVYNREKVIEKTMRSCIEQDYSLKEYIVVDGASNDTTLNIVHKHRKELSHLISEPDSGIYDAMNKAINVATGDWIIFMNAGDIFFNKSVLTEIASFIKKEPLEIDVIYGDTIYCYKENLLKVKPMPLDKINREMIACHQSTLVKTSLIKQQLFDLRYQFAADYDMMYKFFRQKRIFKYINLTISIFNQDEGSTIRNLVQTTKERFDIQDDRGSIKNVYLMYSFIFKRKVSLFIKKLIPNVLKLKIFRFKNRKKIC